MRKLSLLRALFLRKMQVADNERAVALEISYGTTNGGNCFEDRAETWPLAELAGKNPIRLWWGRELCAVVGDRICLRDRKARRVEWLDAEGTAVLGDNVGYDTYEYQQIRLICREEREE